MHKKILFLFALAPLLSNAQEFKRRTFEYNPNKVDTLSVCTAAVYQQLDESYLALEHNNSQKALTILQSIPTASADCPEFYDAKGFSLFRNGDWLKGIETIETGIEQYGSQPELIKRKAEMSLEMGELGLHQKIIDGNSVYKQTHYTYKEEQFKTENFKSALADLEYLAKHFNIDEDYFYIAKIHQILKNYETSNQILRRYVDHPEIGDDARYNLADNLIQLNQLDDAEKEIKILSAKYPKESILYNVLATIASKQNKSSKVEEYTKQSLFHSYVPSFLDLTYSEENFNLIQYFSDHQYSAKEKIARLNSIHENKTQDYTIDVCLTILKMHENHGNGVEEHASKLLMKIGQASIQKVQELFKTDVSTCTINELADVMISLKNETSWELMRSYLAVIPQFPMTLIPPSLPEKMIKYKKEEGIKEVLNTIKPYLSEENNENAFALYVFFNPLKTIKTKELETFAKSVQYTEEEIKLLNKKLK